uniref:Glycine cleavage system H protein n=1 Tax=Quercus lobata TaxID=97700 RepID=A0A7N2MWB6_QUELO
MLHVVLKDLKYLDSHEWVKVEGNSATVGITDHAQDHLGDVVYIELPEVGAPVSQGDSFGVVESVKATNDINSPISGKVVEVNEELNDSPGLAMSLVANIWNTIKSRIDHKGNSHATKLIELKVDAEYVSSFISFMLISDVSVLMWINSSPYDKGWIIKVEVSDSGELKSLMDADKYTKFCEEDNIH